MKIKEIIQMAAGGDAKAQALLAECYENGKGVVRDMEKAVKWYKKAAQSNFAPAQYNLSCLTDGEESLKWLIKAAENGFAAAQCNLGCHYIDSGEYEQAFKQFKSAAENGDKTACFNLAKCYRDGIGTEKNDTLADEWNKKI